MGNRTLIITFFMGAWIALVTTELLEATIIPVSLVFVIWALVGLIGTLCFRGRIDGRLWGQVVYYIAVLGSPIVYAGLATNYYLADENVVTTIVPISEIQQQGRSSRGRCVEPAVRINYHGTEKSFAYPCGTDFTGYKSLRITVSRGYFNYPIIRDYELSSE
ncbi:hypothetical protein MKQ70_08685 [Chitinophaga sedimenti]|uniref:hypothetical protein n=1 Tax=Chitinophaga sedimenti TaxID=2033606 RepID=UPI0020051574|nr:hypothetical protein [Chitinophaga sedimenti]MCK7555081.1 hypothetical protein [Chitinophaga sedimenti]